MSTQKLAQKAVLTIGLAIILLVLMGFVSRKVDLGKINGYFVSVSPASIWGSAVGPGKCRLTFHQANGEPRVVDLVQGIDVKPILVIPAINGRTFFCLYDSDTDVQILRIDPTKPSRPVHSSAWSPLNAVSLSTCLVEESNFDDRQQVLGYIAAMSSGAFRQQVVPRFDLGFVRFGLALETKTNLFNRIKSHG